MRIPDRVAIHPPDVRPAPGVLQEPAGDPPQGVALDHGVRGRHGVFHLELGGLRRGRTQNPRRDGGEGDAFRCAKLLTHKASSGGGGPCYRPKPPQNKGLGRILHPESAFCKVGSNVLLNILEFPDPRLRKVATPVAAVTPEIVKLVRDMAETMYAAPGIGLAATQVDVHKRIVVMDLSETKDELRVFINPELLAVEGRIETEEGCLSVPGYYDEVTRGERVRVRAQDERGEPFELEAEGLLAVCIQHELDHLMGKVFVDHLSPLKRARLAAKARKKQRLAG
ncbi:MAG: peptide deformylase [Betaproteobacteria bacterium]|nr:peptide deformylase [Betaproteobacteria bacterium]